MSNAPLDLEALDRAVKLDPSAYTEIRRQAMRARRRGTMRTTFTVAAATTLVVGGSAVAGIALNGTDNSTSASNPASSVSEMDDSEWEMSIAEFQGQLLRAAELESTFSGSEIDRRERALILYGTGPLPDSLRAIIDSHPAQVTVRWVTVEYSVDDYAAAAARLAQEIPEAHTTEWNGWGPVTLIADPAYRSSETELLDRARAITPIPVRFLFQEAPVAGVPNVNDR